MKSWRLSSLSPTSPRWTCCCLDGPSCTFAFYLLIYCLYVLFRELPFQVMGAFISFSEHCSFRFVDTLSRLYIGIRSVVYVANIPRPPGPFLVYLSIVFTAFPGLPAHVADGGLGADPGWTRGSAPALCSPLSPHTRPSPWPCGLSARPEMC